MLPFLTEHWGVPSAPHRMGQELFPAMEESLRAIYNLVGAKEQDLCLFTSSGAEAVNQAILSAYFEITRVSGKNQFLTSQIEEAPALMSINRLEQLGAVSKLISPNHQGIITPQAVADAISPRTALISLSWANGLTGVVQPIADIAALCHERGICLHVDATHVLGKLFYELNDTSPHFISFNGDQLHAPQGTGGLYVKQGTRCSPFIVGGIEQGGYRAGTINIPGLVALGEAAQEAFEARDFVCTEIARLRNKLEEGIQAEFSEAIPLFQDQERLPNCTTIVFPGILNESLLFMLNRKNIYANIGGGSFQQLSLILKTCGVEESTAQGAISFALSRYTTEEEIDLAIPQIGEAARKLKPNCSA